MIFIMYFGINKWKCKVVGKTRDIGRLILKLCNIQLKFVAVLS